MTFPATVTIRNIDETLIYQKKFATQDEYENFKKPCVISREFREIKYCSIITARTNNLNNFAKDFFLPTFVNTALKFHSIWLKIFESPVFLIWDIVTFPIRVITLIPRIIYNQYYAKEKHPLYLYLIKEGVVPNQLINDQVYINVNFATKKSAKPANINFIEMPYYMRDNKNHSEEHSDLNSKKNGLLTESAIDLNPKKSPSTLIPKEEK